MSLEAISVCKAYRGVEGDVIALHPTGVKLSRGRVIAVMGRSGSGKSTLLKILGGVEPPDSGRVFLDGEEVRGEDGRARVRRGLVACVYQDYNLVPELTFAENILLAQRVSGKCLMSPSEALERVSLGAFSSRLPSQASGGEQQRAAIARALAVGARYLLADEPTGALDEESAIQVCDVFRNVANGGAGVLVVTHDPVVGERADARWRMSRGRLEVS